MRASIGIGFALAAVALAQPGCTPPQQAATSAEQAKGVEQVKVAWKQDVELFPDAGPGHFAYGQAVALSGSVLAVGEPAAAESGVYLYRRQTAGWRREARLTHPAGIRDVGFGYALAVSDGTLVVGAPGEGAGAAYVYAYVSKLGEWVLQARLAAPVPGGWFGRAVAALPDVVVVGAPTDGGTGAAYVYVPAAGTWLLAQRLTGSDTAPGDFFGGAVAIDGGTLVVGAELHADLGGTGGAVVPRRGAAYVFAGAGAAWTEEEELCSCDALAWDYLGFSVDVSGDTVVVGNAKQHAGAHVFVRTAQGWIEEAELFAPEDESTSGFGHQVAVSGDWIALGAPWGDHEGQLAAGEAYSFQRVNGIWTRHALLDTDDPAFHLDCFGDAVAIDGRTIAVGATRDDEGGVDVGAVYLYRLTGK